MIKTMQLAQPALARKLRTFAQPLFLGAALFYGSTGYAQQNSASATSSSPSLEQLQGYYQMPNKVAFVAFEQKDTSLVATQLWNGKVFELVRINATNFKSQKEGYPIEFLKDNSGHFNQAKLLGRITTNRVAFNPNTIVPLSKAQLQRLEGTYLMKDRDNFKINIQSTQAGLTLTQVWDNKTFVFHPRSETFFLNEDGTFPLTFTLENGQVAQLICFENDQWTKVN